MNIFVAKLSYSTSEETLRDVFEAFGEVDSAKIIMDRETGRSKGFGFVEMPDDDAAEAAIENIDGSEIDGRRVVAKKAVPREEMRGRGGNGGGRRFNNDRGGRSGGGFNRRGRDPYGDNKWND